jgi:hypothetical protein
LIPNSDQLNRLSGYYAAQLITKEMDAAPRTACTQIFAVTLKQRKSKITARSSLCTTVHRPDNQWALLRNQQGPQAYSTTHSAIQFFRGTSQVSFARRPLMLIQFSPRSVSLARRRSKRTSEPQSSRRRMLPSESIFISTNCHRIRSRFCAGNFRIDLPRRAPPPECNGIG